jgi:hypothetical protein
METELDFDDAVEKAINDMDSEEEIASEYADNEAAEQKFEKTRLSGRCEEEKKELSLVKRVSDYLVEKPCCIKNCCSTWKEDDLKNHAEDMAYLSKNEKKIVILTIFRNNAINSESTRYSEHRQRLRFTFRYEPFGVMCASAFRLLFDLHIEVFKGLLAHIKVHNMSIVPPVHGNRGKGSHKSDTIVNRGVTEKVIEFMLALGESQGEFCAGRHTKEGSSKEDKEPDLLWLPSCLTRSAILRIYNKQYPNFYIGRTAFCFLLLNEPRLKHIRIRSPRSDMCDYCELQKRKIASTKPHDEKKAEELTAELAVHQKAYQGERAVYNCERERAKLDRKKFMQGKLKVNECIEHIGMDYGQSIGVPYTTDQLGGTYYLHMRNFHLFGVCSALENTQLCYTYDEREAGKGPNEVISFLHEFLATRKIKTPTIRIHADNCRGQNKNKYVIWYLIWLAATGRVRHIELKFMVKGHTHFIVDSGIGHTKRELRKSDVFCLAHWAKVINRSATTNKARVVDGNDVYDWKKALSPYFKAFNGITKFQHFAADNTEPGWIWVKYGFGDDEWKKRKLLKPDMSKSYERLKDIPKYLSTVGFKGGKPEKEKALFENLRQYVKDDWKDELCPDPKIFKSPIRIERPCPDWISVK